MNETVVHIGHPQIPLPTDPIHRRNRTAKYHFEIVISMSVIAFLVHFPPDPDKDTDYDEMQSETM
jgi:hypothetical protein